MTAFALEGDIPEGRWLLVWPPGYSRRGNAIFRGDQRIAADGDTLSLGGGEYHAEQYDFLRTLLATDIPEECRGGAYRLVTEVVD